MWGGIGLVGLSFAVKDLPFLRQRLGYNLLFLAPHRLGAGVFLIGYLIHRPSLPFYAWLSIPVIVLASDRFVELYRYSHASCLTSDPLVCRKNGVTSSANGEEPLALHELSKAKLELLQPEGMQVQAGQMVYANFLGRPHPLTVAKVDNRQISLIVGGAGVGTKRLLAAIEDKSLKKPDPVTLTGPYATQLQSLRFGKAPLVAVSGGAGMSVTGAVLDRLASSDHEVPAVFLLHSDRDTQSFELLLEEAAVAKEHGVPVQGVHLFLTGKNADDVEAGQHPELRRTIARLGMHLVEDDAVSSQDQRIQVHVHRGRINARSLKRSKTMQASSFVVMAGNPGLVSDLSAFCTKYGLRYHAEDFQ